jgi:enoyl-CoA hydratase/carnithine racemase
MAGDEILLKEVRSHVGTLTFNRPEKRNALSLDLLIKIHMTLQEWDEDGEVRVVVITGGSGKAFSSGYDIAAIPTEVTPEIAELMKHKNPLKLAMESVECFPYPTIAMLNGYAFGAGLNLAMCCDIRIAADDISVSMPPAKLGLVYHPDGIRQFIEVVGMARTREIFFTGRTFRGREIQEKGLVDYLVPAHELHSVTYTLAEEIAANAPLSLKGTKRIINMFCASHALKGRDLKEAEELLNEAYNSKDLVEGQTAFFEKRKPRFTGR